MHSDEHYLAEALEQARVAASRGELPYGAVVVTPDGRTVARTHDQVNVLRDLTAHAELLAVRSAAASDHDLDGYRLYSTVEPCAMCFSAAWTARFAAVTFSLGMRELAGGFPDAMDEVVIDCEDLNALATRRVELRSGVLRDECLAVWRQHGRRRVV